MTFPISNTNDTEDLFSPVTDNPQKLRKASKSDAQTRQRRIAATQRAKREVLANLKEDWIWSRARDQPDRRFPRRRNSTQWRERESDSTPLASRSPSPSSQNPYRFESPDAVKPLASTLPSKRRELMKEELEWNEGLKTFVERRDCWTGAESPAQNTGQGRAQSEHLPENGVARTNSVALISTTLATSQGDPLCRNTPESAALGTSDSDKSIAISNAALDTSASILSSNSPSARTSKSSAVFSTSTCRPSPPSSSNKKDPTLTLVPLAPPLLSPTTHPDLAEITPAIYPAIYSKCVVQGLAPSFPINLKDVVRCLVQGWKDDGEWPPKPTVPEKGSTVPKRDILKDKMRGLKVDADDVGLERVARRGVGKVKRALGR
ncbi:MAG: hypothetical protein LQ344_002308 [Seirophora lacunosa]|nr:MAG: hypothetical protein LQ344_002308 [Seirophora lacunosa]